MTWLSDGRSETAAPARAGPDPAGHAQAGIHVAVRFERFAQLSPDTSERCREDRAESLIATADGPFGARNPESRRPWGRRPERSGAVTRRRRRSPALRKNRPNFNQASGKDYVVFEGTVLETLLVTRLNSDFSGPVICMLTNSIYSHDGQHLLVPAGAKVLGQTKRVEGFGQTRLAVVFHRLIMPDGYSVDLDQFQGLNQIGETGLKDKVNHHYFEIFGASVAVGAIAGLAEAGTNTSSLDWPRQRRMHTGEGVAASLSQSSLHILDRFLNLLPTITIREGRRVKVYLTQDLLLPDYAQHEMPSRSLRSP